MDSTIPVATDNIFFHFLDPHGLSKKRAQHAFHDAPTSPEALTTAESEAERLQQQLVKQEATGRSANSSDVGDSLGSWNLGVCEQHEVVDQILVEAGGRTHQKPSKPIRAQILGVGGQNPC